jgi:hypothetical protein
MGQDRKPANGHAWYDQHINRPAGALTWRSSRERDEVLAAWRDAVCRHPLSRFDIRAAWVIRDSLNYDGSTTITDKQLARHLGSTPNKAQAAVRALADVNAIIRVTEMTGTGSGVQRSRTIWAAPVMVGGVHPESKGEPYTPPVGVNPVHPYRGGDKYKDRARAPVCASTEAGTPPSTNGNASAPAETPQPPRTRDVGVQERILTALRSSPYGLSVADIQTAAGLTSRNGMYVTLHQMNRAGTVERIEQGWYGVPGAAARWQADRSMRLSS